MKKIVILGCEMALSACTGYQSNSDGGVFNNKAKKNATAFPKVPFKGVKVGKPYRIKGKLYKPHYDPDYKQVGEASWYGPGFHGRLTANGEKYNQNGYTAAHTTLPMPSMVRVTNMQNGKSLNVRVNDRGPFHGSRIIDLSKAAAQKLGVINSGVARVKVKYLPEETKRYIESKGKHGDDVHYTTGFTDYQPIEPNYLHQSPKDIESVSMQRQGTQTAAPVRNISMSSLPDITPQQVEQMHATWLVQVASYADTSNAQMMMSKLRTMGEPSMQTINVKGAPFYRVLLTPNSPQQSQAQMLSRLESKFDIVDAKVIHQ